MNEGRLDKGRVTVLIHDGVIICDPPYAVEACPGESISWACHSPFAIHFSGLSPLGKASYRGAAGTLVGDRVTATAPFGRYKYFIAVLDKNGEILTEDPDIIIKPRP